MGMESSPGLGKNKAWLSTGIDRVTRAENTYGGSTPCLPAFCTKSLLPVEAHLAFSNT